MPVYLFTYHAYRSWMPDHKRGYTKRSEGYQRPDEEVAREYEKCAKDEPTLFDRKIQKILIEELQKTCKHISCRLLAGTSEPSHVHGLASWKHQRRWMSIRSSIKTSLTKRLKQLDKSLRLSRGASRKHVITCKHFDHLMKTYLPKHAGVGWFEDRGWIHE